MTDDYTTDPEFIAWMRDVREKLIPKLEQSSVVVSLMPSSGEADVKIAVEVGLALFMDKPIILAVRPGQRVPAKLVAVAEEIIEYDRDASPEKMQKAFIAAVERVRKREGHTGHGG